MRQSQRACLTRLCVAISIVSFGHVEPAGSQAARGTLTGNGACKVDVPVVQGQREMKGVKKALALGTLRILAIGSSSTSGVGASSQANSYPNRLIGILKRQWRGKTILIVNRGIGGETLDRAAKRMPAEIAAAKADLVLWQLGTNAALGTLGLGRMRQIVRSVVKQLRQRSIELVLIDPQHSLRFAQHARMVRFTEELGVIARDEEIVLVRRYAAMRELEKTRDLADFLAPDRFHMNDRGYACLAEYVAHAVLSGVNMQVPADGGKRDFAPE